MEAELREAFARVEAKIDTMRSDMHKNSIDAARELQKLSSSAAAAHRRLDEHVEGHREARKWWGALWVGLLVSSSTAVWAWIKSSFKGGGP